jgi:hypothetical protein
MLVPESASTWAEVKNTGTAAWLPSNTDFMHVSGTKMYQAAVLPLPTEVASGDVIAFKPALLSPRTPAPA